MLIRDDHTPLDRLEPRASSALRALMAQLWIESLEELIAAVSAAEASELDASVMSPLRGWLVGVPDEKLREWRSAQAGHALGYSIDPEVMARFRQSGVIVVNPVPPSAALDVMMLPTRCWLGDKLFPVGQQGDRATCVAFAVVALREFMDGKSEKLSEEFLYWACKSIDGLDAPGTTIHTAMAALSTRGVCSNSLWPYDVAFVDEKPKPPPPPARQEAERFCMQNTRAIATGFISQYKLVLAGQGDMPGMPIAIALLVFDSWLRSVASNESGKITLPLPGEMPCPTGHAMLVVGYQDDTTAPGGGYFIARNSWGKAWAPLSPEASGHAMIPYTYVERYVLEAYSGEVQPLASAEGVSAIDALLSELTRKQRDGYGKLLNVGARVLRDPSDRNIVWEDTPANRRMLSRMLQPTTSCGRSQRGT